MPTETFLKLSEEKQNKIILAAKKEFSRASIEEVSIKNIVEEAGIARGSFYQYFESKEDLLGYIIRSHIQGLHQGIETSLKETQGDIFSVFIGMYDYMVNQIGTTEEFDLFKRIFENAKVGEDSIFNSKLKEEPPFNHKKYMNCIDKSKLNIQSDEDIITITKILYAVTRRAIISNYRYGVTESSKKEFRRAIEFLKYGMLKKEEENNVKST